MMKTLRYFTAVIVLPVLCTVCAASETSDKFTKCLPNLAAEDLGQRRNAQQEWQDYCRHNGNNPAVCAEIVSLSAEQLEKDTPDETAVWLIRQLGIAGNASAVPVLAKYLAKDDIRLRDEAARALANIPGKEAADALKAGQSEQAKAALMAKNTKTNPPAIRTETAMPLALPYAPDADVKKWMTGYASLDNAGKTAALSGLTVRASQGAKSKAGCAVYIPQAVEAARSDDPALRNAGFMAVGAFGSAKEVAFLCECAYGGERAGIAKLVLSRMTEPSVDEELVTMLMAEKEDAKFNALAEILRNRYNVTAGPVLLKRAKNPATVNKIQLLQLAEGLSSKEDVGDFIDVMLILSAQADKETNADAKRNARQNKEEAEKIIARFLKGDAAIVMKKVPQWQTSPDVLSLIGRIGDDNTLDQVRQSRNSLLALSNWPNARVAGDLLAKANDKSASEADQNRALRAYIRVMSLNGTKKDEPIGIDISDQDKVKKLGEVFAAAKRTEDKKLIIKRVGQIRTVESLRLVLPYVDNAELQESAAESVLDLAHHVEFKRKHIDEFTAALDKVLAVTKNSGFIERAKRYKDQK